MEEQTLARSIANFIAVGWRKGVDGEGSGRMYQALNPLFFNDDEAIQEIGAEHAQALGEAGAVVIERNGSPEELAEAFKAAAIIERPCKSDSFNITADNQGLAIIKSMCPIYFDLWYGKWLLTVRNDTLYFKRKKEDAEDYENRHYVSEEASSVAGVVLLALIERHPAVKEIFADFLVSQEAEKRKELTDAAKEVTDDGWLSLAHWVMYCLKQDIQEDDN